MFYPQLVIAIVLLTTHSALSESYREIVAACYKEAGLTGDPDTLNFNDPDFSKETKCAVACTLEKQGVLKPDGSIDRKMEKEIPEEVVKDEKLKNKYLQAIEECHNVSAKEDRCEIAFLYMKCLYNSLL
ncbi:unnamed protein product [Nezara viridula]|uniref:Odorant binding protein 35 n=1 Tax=Nezara viridula TaxID=85310 RepID=A0A4Y5RDL5_NEZVI|nr:odorant binding protein 35 [Nezara viridula]CAH1392071.1 unnamed protein product [Nezara viridula]